MLYEVITLMLTRGALRTMIPPASRPAIVLRASGGPSVLKELSNERNNFV